MSFSYLIKNQEQEDEDTVILYLFGWQEGEMW